MTVILPAMEERVVDQQKIPMRIPVRPLTVCSFQQQVVYKRFQGVKCSCTLSFPFCISFAYNFNHYTVNCKYMHSNN